MEVFCLVNNIEISNKAALLRKELGEDGSSPVDIFTLVHTIDNITLILYPLGTKISGVCYKGDSSSVIAINSSMSLGRQRFSLAHELYHLYYDEKMSSSICSNKIGLGNENEKAADKFASYFLMPQLALYETIQKMKKATKRKIDIQDIVKIEQYYGVSRQALLYRLQEEGELSASDAIGMQTDVIANAARLGYDTKLYKPLPIDKQKGTFGYYVKQAENLLNSNVISNGKYEEWLLDAYRDDIVYGEDIEGGELHD